MKKFSLYFLLLAFLMFPSIASAHTHLEASNPANGQVISGELKDITLTFEEQIEKLSTMKLLKNGKEIPFSQVQVQAEKMIGSFNKSIENGPYVIQWIIAGEDGHPVIGEIKFTVQRNQNKQVSTVVKSNQNQVDNGNALQTSANLQKSDDKNKHKENAEKKTEKTDDRLFNTNTTAAIVGFIVIFAFAFLAFFRKKR
jgi:methionine-rich copper-binding protein CopC